jgi:hypothetical protein
MSAAIAIRPPAASPPTLCTTWSKQCRRALGPRTTTDRRLGATRTAQVTGSWRIQIRQIWAASVLIGRRRPGRFVPTWPLGAREWRAVLGAGRCWMLPGLAGRRTIGSAVATARLAVAGNGDAAQAGWSCWSAALGGHHVREGDGTGDGRLVHGAPAKMCSLASPPVLRRRCPARGCGRSAAAPATSAGSGCATTTSRDSWKRPAHRAAACTGRCSTAAARARPGYLRDSPSPALVAVSPATSPLSPRPFRS